MNTNWNLSKSIKYRLAQTGSVFGFAVLIYLQSSSTSYSYEETSVESVQAAEMEVFAPIDGSLPADGDVESAILNVLQSRPLYSVDDTSDVLANASASAAADTANNWENLEEAVTALTDSYDGTWSVYVKSLDTQETISINEQPMESASLIKLFIMAAVMEKIQTGELEQTDQINNLLNRMITVSDNESSNELVRYLSPSHDHKEGLEVVNAFIENHGFSATIQLNGLEDSSLWYSSGVNQTSAADCGRLLEEIYNGTLVSHLASRQMEDLMLAQDITYKIPAALPDDAVIANKTGEVSNAENDTSIIYSKGGDFILCIMSTDWSSKNTAVTHIHEITKTVYGYFNP